MNRPQATAITSGKGGVGKTNLSVNLALVLHKAGQRVGIFDADLALANAHLVLGCRPNRTIVDALSGQCTMAETVVEKSRLLLHQLKAVSLYESFLQCA